MFSMDVVVARYDECLEWLWPIEGRCTVYNKGESQVHGAFKAVRALPNVGREAHTYANHIIDNYDDLPDVTVFVQGCITDHVTGDPVEFVWRAAYEAMMSGLSLNTIRCATSGREYRMKVWAGVPLQQHRGMCLGEWYEDCTGEPYPTAPPPWYCGACFAATRDAIRSVPRETWMHLRASVGTHNSPVASHYSLRKSYVRQI